MAFQIEKERKLSLIEAKNDTKNEAKRIKSGNFTGSNWIAP